MASTLRFSGAKLSEDSAGDKTAYASKTMKYSTSSALANAFSGLRICSPSALQKFRTPLLRQQSGIPSTAWLQKPKAFSTTAPVFGNWLEPNIRRKKMPKGRARVFTGGRTKGTTVIWGDYGLRVVDKQRRISAGSLKVAEDAIRTRLRGEKYRLFTRKCCTISVCVSGNEVRMGKGKGSFDHWATRISVNQIMFEIRGLVHEQVIRDALRLAGHKLPGQWEIAKKGEAPFVGMTQLVGVTLEDLKRPRRTIAPLEAIKKLETTPCTAETTTGSQPPAST